MNYANKYSPPGNTAVDVEAALQSQDSSVVQHAADSIFKEYMSCIPLEPPEERTELLVNIVRVLPTIYKSVHYLYDEFIEAPLYDQASNDATKATNAVLTGRGQYVSMEANLLTTFMIRHYTGEQVTEVIFDDDPYARYRGALASKDYGDVVTDISDSLMLAYGDEPLHFGRADGDTTVFAIVANLVGMVNLALTSDSPKVRQKAFTAIDQLTKLKAGQLTGEARRCFQELEALTHTEAMADNDAEKRAIADALKAGVGDQWDAVVGAHILKEISVPLKHALTTTGQNRQLSRAVALRARELDSRVSAYQALMHRLTELAPSVTSINNEHLPITELDWTVLPEGELTDNAQQIVAEQQTRRTKEITIDLERLKILENIREYWGKDRCYYARGKLTGRRMVKDGNQEQPDEYLILIMQEFDQTGRVTQEHAVAESPIAGPNALYVHRGDVSSEGWRKVFSIDKASARQLGARGLRHTTVHGESLIDNMTDKIVSLFAVEPHEFHQVRFAGQVIRISKPLGAAALDTSGQLYR